MNVKRVKDETMQPIEPFKTIQEEAEYWDTHSVLEDITEDTQIHVHSPEKSDTLTIRFSPEDVRLLREQAAQKGIGPTTLIRMWVRERLQAGKAQHT